MVNPNSVSQRFFSFLNTIKTHCGQGPPNTCYVLDCRGVSFLSLLVDTFGGFKTAVLPAFQEFFLDRWHDQKNTKTQKGLRHVCFSSRFFASKQKIGPAAGPPYTFFVLGSSGGGVCIDGATPQKSFEEKSE